MHVLLVLLRFIHLVLAVGLILGVMFMQTKSDSGLAGIMGGTSGHSTRGIKGLDENFRVIIRYVAGGFLVTSLLNAYFTAA
jgi:protein translocase SecG subunit